MPAQKGNTLSRFSEKEYDYQLSLINKEKARRIKRVDPYRGMNNHIRHQCLKCTHIWTLRPANLIYTKSGCPKCSRKGKTPIFPFEQVKEQVEKARSDLEVLERASPNKNTKLKVRGKDCGHIWVGILNNLLRGSRCPDCFGFAPYTRKTFIEKSRAKFGDVLDYSKVPETLKSHDKITLVCKEHGDFRRRAFEHLNKKYACPQCARVGVARKHTFTKEEFVQRSKSLFGNSCALLPRKVLL